MPKKEEFLEEARSSLKETINDILSDEITPSNILEFLKKVRSVINLLTWESARILDNIKEGKDTENFEVESDIYFPVFPKKLIEVGSIDGMEEGIGLTLLAINFLKKANEKLIEYHKFYGVEIEPVREPARTIEK